MAVASPLPPITIPIRDQHLTPAMSTHLPTPRTITELVSTRAKFIPNEPILGYPTHGTEYAEYTFSDLERLSIKAAKLYSRRLPIRARSTEDAQVVALLGISNLDYVIACLALSRLGFTVLFLSTRISEAAYLSLLEATKCSQIVVDQSFQKTARALTTTRPDLHIHNIVNIQCSHFNIETGDNTSLPKFDLDLESKQVAWIIHSSGSTGLPKPIYQTHKAALLNYVQNMNMKGFITLPLFHAHGLSSVFRSITSVKKIYMHNASLPLTARNLLKIIQENQWIEIFYGVPYAYKLLAENQEGIKALAGMKACMFGGSACPDALGNLLVDAGVNLISHYGTTETGQLMTSMRPRNDKAWNYVREHDKLKPYLRWEDRGANMFELVVLPGWPSKVATNREDGAYATKDLFEPHPSIPGAWKYATRLDDTIVLMNGEKVIPIGCEGAVRQHKAVKEAVMFGTGRSQVGMIVVTADTASTRNSEDIVSAIWPIVETENRLLPSYGQLSRDMIKILPSSTSYQTTDKGTFVRQAFYRRFKDDIEEIYSRLESNNRGTRVLSSSELRSFLRQRIVALVAHNGETTVEDDTDVFSLGVDSLQSTRLRALIMQEIELNGHILPQNIVFEFPTVAKLAQALEDIRDSRSMQDEDVTVEMENLISKYSDLPKHKPETRSSSSNCVVLTGATGSLGAHLASLLAQRNDIDEVCCLVRAQNAETARARVVQSMTDRRVYETLSPEQKEKITCHPSDFSKSDLGLSQELYNELSTKITSLIHCAWSVNFNKKLSSFEHDCISGTRHLMMLCLSAKAPMPASFNFCSSVSTVVNTEGDIVPEALPENLKYAQNMGYAQSKVVTENIVARATSSTSMKARVLRVGQIIADTQHGIWNDTEAIPMMLQAATTFGALPTLDENPRWLPVDEVAQTCIDVSLSSTDHGFFNVVNPRTFHWTKDLLPALHASGLGFQEVGQREWIRRLRASNPDPMANPTVKLTEFFAGKYDNDRKARSLDYCTQNAETCSPTLARAKDLDQGLVEKFVKHFLATSWRRSRG